MHEHDPPAPNPPSPSPALDARAAGLCRLPWTARTLGWFSLLIACTGIVCFSGLYGGAGFEPTDCWVAQTAREMHAGTTWHDFIVPRFSGETRMQKSPGPYWAVIATAAARGTPVDEAAARIPNGIAAVLLVMTIFWLTRRIAGDRAAVFAGFAAAGSVLVLYWSHRGASDLGVATFTTVSLACLWVAANEPPGAKRALLWIGCYFAAGLGMLYKLPMSLVTVGLPALVYVLLRKRWRMLGRPIHLVGLGVFLLPWLPWAVSVALSEPTALAKWRVEYLDRFTGDLPNVQDQRTDLAIYFVYLLAPLVYCLPFSLSLPQAVGRALRRDPAVNRDGQVFLLIWFLSHLAFFTAAAGKELRYFLPAIPPLLVLLGIELSAFFDPQRPRNWKRVKVVAGAVTLLTAAGFAAGTFAVRIWFRQRGSAEGFAWSEVWPPYAITAAIFSVGVGLAAALFAARRTNASFAALVGTMWAVWLYGWPALGPVFASQRAFQDFATQLRERIPPADVARMRMIGTQDSRHIWLADYRFPRIIDQLRLLEMQGGRRSLPREMWLTAKRITELLNGEERVLLVAPLLDYALFQVGAERVAARIGEPPPPAHLWLRTRVGREDQHFVVFSNHPPAWEPPPPLVLSDRLRARLEAKLTAIEAQISDLAPATRAASRAATAAANGDAGAAGGD